MGLAEADAGRPAEREAPGAQGFEESGIIEVLVVAEGDKRTEMSEMR